MKWHFKRCDSSLRGLVAPICLLISATELFVSRILCFFAVILVQADLSRFLYNGEWEILENHMEEANCNVT